MKKYLTHHLNCTAALSAVPTCYVVVQMLFPAGISGGKGLLVLVVIDYKRKLTLQKETGHRKIDQLLVCVDRS